MRTGDLERDYTAIAPAYERTRYDSPAGRFLFQCESPLLRNAILTHATRRDVLIDVACGTGHFTATVADLFRHVVGVDLTWAMLSRARARGALQSQRHLSLVQGSASHLPVSDGVSDVVLSTRFLHLFPRERHREILEALLRPLRPGGVLIVDHDTWFVQWRGRSRDTTERGWSNYHAGETPTGARLVARIGISGPRLPRLALRWPTAARRLSHSFEKPPFNRLATMLIVVYRKWK